MNESQYLELIEKVNKYRNQIHLFNIEEISESALDDLKHKITIYESQNPNKISKNSPNYTIAGGISEGFEKFQHKRRMISLADIFTLEELIDWENRFIDFSNKNEIKLDSIEYICEPKIDGLAISLHYKDGVLIKGITRGDGFVGEDVTQNIMQIDSIPKIIPDKRGVEVRGELFFTKDSFERLNNDVRDGKKVGKMGKTGIEAVFSNPRNAASGTIRQLNSGIVKERNLSFIAYNLYIEE